MKGAIKISSVLSWINIIFCGLGCLYCLSSGLMSGNMLYLLAGVIVAAVVLHSYATLRLHKSLRDPSLPLSDQTPTGIRFVGFVALFLGLMYVAFGIALVRNAKELLSIVNGSALPNMAADERVVRIAGLESILLGLSITINVILSLRLLRWYYMMHEDDNKEDIP